MLVLVLVVAVSTSSSLDNSVRSGINLSPSLRDLSLSLFQAPMDFCCGCGCGCGVAAVCACACISIKLAASTTCRFIFNTISSINGIAMLRHSRE